MKKTLLSLALCMGTILAANAGDQEITVADAPLSNGQVKFYSSDWWPFDMESIDFDRAYNVYDEASQLVGTVLAERSNYAGYGEVYSAGAFTWTISEPGTYTIDIPEDSFFFLLEDGSSHGNIATQAKVTIEKIITFDITTSLHPSDVNYVTDLEGIVLTFEGAETVEVGEYGSVAFKGFYADLGKHFSIGSWAGYSGTCECNGNSVTLYGIESWEDNEVFDVRGTVYGTSQIMIDYGFHGFVVDGIDITADIEFSLTEGEVTSAGLPVYKANVSDILDLQGRRTQGKGLQIRNGRVELVK